MSSHPRIPLTQGSPAVEPLRSVASTGDAVPMCPTGRWSWMVFATGMAGLSIALMAGFDRGTLIGVAIAGSCAFVGMLAGQIPLRLIRPDQVDRLPSLMLAISICRLMVAVVSLLAFVRAGIVDPQVLAFSFFLWYGLLMLIDLVGGTRYVRQLFPTSVDALPDHPTGQITS